MKTKKTKKEGLLTREGKLKPTKLRRKDPKVWKSKPQNEVTVRRPSNVPQTVWNRMGPLQRFNLVSGVLRYNPTTKKTSRTDLRSPSSTRKSFTKKKSVRKKVTKKKVTKRTRRVDWLKSLTKESLVMISGDGSFRFDDGSKYTGQLKGGVFHGIGIRVWEDGTIYSGDWKKGVIQGHGRIIYPSGVEYIGSWKDGVKSGRGTLFRKNGTMFSGDWEDGLVRKPLTSRWVYLDGEFIKITELPGVVKKRTIKKKTIKKKTTKKKVVVEKDKIVWDDVVEVSRVEPINELISTLGLAKTFVHKLKVKSILTLRDLTHYSPLQLIEMCGLSPKIDVDQLEKLGKHLKRFGLRMKSSKQQDPFELVDTRSLSSSERRRLSSPSGSGLTVQFDKSGVYIGRKKS